MRSSVALFASMGLIFAGCALIAHAADDPEPVNPFTPPAPGDRAISANISDELSDSEEKTGFFLPKLRLPRLPKPSLPKPSMPAFKLPNVKVPKVAMPQWGKRDPSPTTGPSAWERLNTGTKSIFTKARVTLLPWTVNDKPPAVRNATGGRNSTGVSRTRVASNRNRGESSSEQKTLFSSFLRSPEPEEKRIETTMDFLSQERPQFD